MEINVVGLGFTGIATAFHLAEIGHDVRGWDIDPLRVAGLERGELPFPDRDLISSFNHLKGSERIRFLQDRGDFEAADLWLICVGTPAVDDGSLDLADVANAVRQTLERCRSMGQRDPVIVLRSTLPAGTCESQLMPMIRAFEKAHADFKVHLFYFPEFLREGSSMADMQEPPLSVLGGEAPFERASVVEAAFRFPAGRLKKTTFGVAEIVKLSCNAFHGLKVAFANEISSLCHSLGIDGTEAMRLFTEDRKLNISPAYLRPGFAFGGPCLEKDLGNIERQAAREGLDLPLVGSVLRSNRAHASRAFECLEELTNDEVTVGFLGLGFKSESSDRRSSPTLRMMKRYQTRFPARTVLSQGPLEDMTAKCQVLVLGPFDCSPTELTLLKNFRGTILDLMYDGKISEALWKEPGYRRLC